MLDAIEYAVGANDAHGLPRSPADKRQCVLLALEKFGDRSNRALARMCRVHHETVSNVRAAQLAKSPTETPSTRIGQDGKKYKAEHANGSKPLTSASDSSGGDSPPPESVPAEQIIPPADHTPVTTPAPEPPANVNTATDQRPKQQRMQQPPKAEPPRMNNAMQYAVMATVALGKIQPEDASRNEARRYVEEWLNEHLPYTHTQNNN